MTKRGWPWNTNTSGLEPRGKAVLIEMYEPQQVKSLIAIPEMVREKTDMVEQRAIVVAIGPTCWTDERKPVPFTFGLLTWACPRAKVGDRVLVTRFAGYMTKGPADGRRYRLVNDRDIFCAIVSEELLQESSEIAEVSCG